MRKTKKRSLLLAVLAAASVLVSGLPQAAAGLDDAEPRGSNPGGNDGGSKVGSPEWEVLTKRNFSSQIRLHPHVLVMVTVPWSGESRFLMKEVSHVVRNDQLLFGHLKLMVILADALDATEGVTLLYYHHSESFRYRGRLRAQNILSSFSHIMSLQQVEFPLKFLNTVEDLENFFRSTDKAVLLLEFCGWTAKLLHHMNNGTEESSISEQRLRHYGDNHGANFTDEADGTTFSRKENQKVGSENEKLSCGVGNELSGVPWLGDFALANDTTYLENEAKMSNIEAACTLDKFQQFKSFFPEFNKIVKEFFLPPESQRFGVITERSLLPFLGLEDPDAWMLLIHFSGFPSLSESLWDVNDLRIALQNHHFSIREVDRDQRGQENVFPVNGPSIILFIDRSSDSLSIRNESKYALEVYRQLVHHYQLPGKILRDQDNDHSRISQKQAFHNHMRSKGSSTSKVVKVGDKMAFMIVNEGKGLSLDSINDSNGENPSYHVLQQLLHREDSVVKTKEVKISLLAKEIGFQLLSDDFDVEFIDLQPPDQGDLLRSITESPIGRSENKILQHPLESSVNEHGDESADTDNIVAAADRKESTVVTSPEPVSSGDSAASLPSSSKESSKDDTQHLKGSGSDADIYTKPIEFSPSMSHTEAHYHLKHDVHDDKEPSEEDHIDHTDCTLSNICHDEVAYTSGQHSISECSMQKGTIKEKYSTGTGSAEEQQVCHPSFTGYFFFSDGGYRLLRSLTGGLEIPSIVIIDPVLHHHYVLPKEKDFTFYSLVNFVDKFLNGSLPPYQRSESIIPSPRDIPQPPFVNLDFHEADSIPRVTVNTFSELVLCSTHRDDGGRTPSVEDIQHVCAWKGDTLVLFTNSWCGLCQRMELIVREVYRAFKNFKKLLGDPTDKLEDASIHDFPSIYHMDCTFNECSPFLRKYGKGEVYPSLLLFTAEKDAITYEGDISVLSIFDFLATHGSNSNNLNEYKGILWDQPREGRRGSGEASNDVFPAKVHEETPLTEDDEHSDLPSDLPKVRQNKQQPVDLHPLIGEGGERVAVGSVLTATDKLLNASPFDKSSILIVKADRNEGFQGLILNKHIGWDVFEKLHESLLPLREAPLSYGGPVRINDLPLLSLTRKLTDGYSKVASNIYLGDPLATARVIERVGGHNTSAGDFWFFLGFSSWGWGQLFDELAEGAWQLGVLSAEHFDWPET
ncbi:hypothetical protein Taro_030863 [Colocasia esculenta]|uniref:Thioredoxin domain-containing protein n=1 Tax=Colocasia esculenta TaxID=4460 RepID=A0A843VHF2_COLES|nr:hypothetical protein [Colocasia esculenta]